MTENDFLNLAYALGIFVIAFICIFTAVFIRMSLKLKEFRQATYKKMEHEKQEADARFTAIAKSILDDKSKAPHSLLYCIFDRVAQNDFIVSNSQIAAYWFDGITFKIKDEGSPYTYDEASELCKQIIRNKFKLKKI